MMAFFNGKNGVKKDLRKVFSFILVLALVIGLMPAPAAFAAIPDDMEVVSATGSGNTVASSLEPGQIVTDKTVEYLGNNLDQFKITLYAMGRDYPNPETSTGAATNIDVVFVLDASGSMGDGSKLADMKAAAISSVNRVLGTPGNRVAVVKYSHMAEIVQGFTPSTSAAIAQINALGAKDGTNIQNAFFVAETLIKNNRSDNKPIIILMSDGKPTYYHTTLNDQGTVKSPKNRGGNGQNNNTSGTHVWQTILQAKQAKDNINDLSIYTIGFGVGTDKYAMATLMPTDDNTKTYRPIGYSGEKRVLVDAEGTAQFYKHQTWYLIDGWGSWSGWIPTKSNEPYLIGTHYIPYKATNENDPQWTTYSDLPEHPVSTVIPTWVESAPAGPKWADKGWEGTARKGYEANVFKAKLNGTEYRNQTSGAITFAHQYYSSGSAITGGTLEDIMKAFDAITTTITNDTKPVAYTKDGDTKEYEDITITDTLGEGFKLATAEADLPAGVTYDSATRTITWTLTPGAFQTSASDSTEVKQNTISFKVELDKDVVTAGTTYNTNASAGAIFNVMKNNPRYTSDTSISWDGEKGQVQQTIDVTGSITLQTTVIPGPNATEFTFIKLDSHLGTPVVGAEFTLAAENFGKTASSDAKGYVTFRVIPAGVYTLTETDPATGYKDNETEYQVTVTEGDDDFTTVIKAGDATLETVSVDGEDFPVIENDPDFKTLTVKKTVAGSKADAEENLNDIYTFEISFENGFYLTADDIASIVSEGAVWIDESSDSDQVGEFASMEEPADEENDGVYRFTLPRNGSITFNVRAGVLYTVYEILDFDGEPTYFPVYILTGGTDNAVTGEVVSDSIANNTEIVVQNHYGNDGLTVRKVVENKSDDTRYGFTATFWTEEIVPEELLPQLLFEEELLEEEELPEDADKSGEEPGDTEEPGTGTDEPGTGSEEPGTGTDEPGTGSEEPGTGTDEPGTGSDEPGTGTDEPGTGSDEPGTDVKDEKESIIEKVLNGFEQALTQIKKWFLSIGTENADIIYSVKDGMNTEDFEVEIGEILDDSVNEIKVLRFSLAHSEEIVFNFDKFFDDEDNAGKTIHFTIKETDAKGADSVAVEAKRLGTTEVTEAVITGTITVNTAGDPEIIYTNTFDKEEPTPGPTPNPTPPSRPSPRPSTPPVVITPEPIPEAPVPEEIILDEEIPAAPLPKTGGIPAILLFGAGALLAGGGLILRRKEDEEK